MDEYINADIIVNYLTRLWSERLPHLSQYLDEHFRFFVTPQQRVRRLFIAQMGDGNVTTGNIGGVYCSKWVMSEGSIEKVPLDYAYQEMYETDSTGEIFLSPSFLFCFDQNAILLSERYGPSLKLRLRGQVVQNGQEPTIEWAKLWSTADNLISHFNL
jgi:hypothetical protein